MPKYLIPYREWYASRAYRARLEAIRKRPGTLDGWWHEGWRRADLADLWVASEGMEGTFCHHGTFGFVGRIDHEKINLESADCVVRLLSVRQDLRAKRDWAGADDVKRKAMMFWPRLEVFDGVSETLFHG